MQDPINNKRDDTNLSMVVNATLLDIYNGENITVHEDQPWAYKFHVPHWPEGEDILLGRGEAELKVGMGYMLHGHLSINEGKGWTRTAYEIDDAVELCSIARPEDRAPEFRVSGLILAIKDGWVTLGWERNDDDLGNFAWVYVKAKNNTATDNMLFKRCYMEGKMDGYDRMKDWIADAITIAT